MSCLSTLKGQKVKARHLSTKKRDYVLSTSDIKKGEGQLWLEDNNMKKDYVLSTSLLHQKV
jgi:hypothetical protein